MTVILQANSTTSLSSFVYSFYDVFFGNISFCRPFSRCFVCT